MKTAEGYAIEEDDMHWTVQCPSCEKEMEYTGFFDSSDTNKCTCGCEFITTKIWITETKYIQ